MPIARSAKLRVLGVAVAGLVAVSASACDATSGPAGGAPDGARQVTVVGSGHVQGVPDTLTADVAMEFTAPDVSGALNQSSQRQQAVIDALVGSGVDRKDISTTQVSVQPQFTDNTITGYRASNAIKVKIRDTAKASQTLALIASTGGTPPASIRSTTRSRTIRIWCATPAPGHSTTPRTAPTSTPGCRDCAWAR